MDHSMGMVWVESHQQLVNAEVDDNQRSNYKVIYEFFQEIRSF